MNHRDAEITDVIIVLDCPGQDAIDDSIAKLKTAGLSVVEILPDEGVIEGNIDADTLWIDGFVRGDVTAKTLVVLSSTGRVVGNIRAKNVKFEFGSYFEGKCMTEGDPATANPSGSPI